ncbi:MAG TPA: RCC1 domain-containing protein, partial [Planctomycetota bacterium]|nr:RCC1 domain-containing protein [Planctomycetota bacterium]
GYNGAGQCNVPSLPSGLTYVEVAAGYAHTVARRSDGSVVAWGYDGYYQCNVPALPPGMTVSRIAAGRDTSAAIIQSGGFHTFAGGCPGSAGVTRLHAAPPRVGTTTQIALRSLPQSAAVLVFGFSNVSSSFGPLPLDLTGFGMPGCFARVSLDFSAPVLGSGGAAAYPFVVPSLPALAGTILHSQAIVFDAAAGNPAGLVMSDAATLVVGP